MSKDRRVHPLVRLDYAIRLVACPMGGLLVAVSRLQDGAAPALWAFLAFYSFVWPHLAYAAGRASSDPRSTERLLLLVDCAFAGAALPLSSFRPVVILAFLTCYVAILASIGGWGLLAAGLPALVAAALFTGATVTGFRIVTESSWLETGLSGAVLFAFQFLMAIQTWRQARGFVASRRQVEEQAQEIRRQNEELVVAREQALEAARAKAAFLATMSHEIRTPLNGVLGMTRLLAESPLSPEQHEYLSTIQTSGQQLLSIINDILDYSKIESGRLDLEDEPLRVADVVEEALEMVAERARAKGLELVHHVEPGVPPTIRGDITRLRQVLTNLLGNAVKFTAEGEVVVTTRLVRAETVEEPAEIAFAVRDTGTGIPADRLPRLFSAFSQVDASITRRFGGTGLGLAISRRLTELMGGGLTVESEAGVGSTFTFSIRARAARDVPTRSWDPGLAAGRRVLVVDDNATNRRVLCAQLQAWGFGSEPAEGAQAALEALSDGRPFAVAILDLHMPDVDGLELARRIRALRRDLPLVLLSSSQLEPGLEAGLFVAKLLKPARQSRLFDAVARALGAAAPESVTIQPVPGRRLSDLAPLRLLVVDDNEVNRTIAGLVLRRFGFRPDVAVNGREAVEKVLHHLSDAPDALPYDVVFMDVHMPELDGLAATRELGFQREARPDAPWPEVVAMTADAMQGDREACLAAGMDDYLTKPLDFEAVEVVLERAVVRRVSGAGARSQGTARGPGPAAEGPSAAPAQAPDAPALVDWSRLDELREFDTPDGAIVRAAVDAFTAQAPGLLSALRGHVQRGDASAVRDTAHALKGSASNVGAVSLSSLASSIERAGRSGDLAEAPDLVGGLDGVLEATLDELRRRG